MTPEEQIKQLTRAVSLLIFSIQRGPLFGAKGSSKEAANDAREIVNNILLSQKNQKP